MDEKCTCLFCNCKCPKCGQTGIVVSIRPVFEFTNNMPNKLTMTGSEVSMKVACSACGFKMQYDDELPESGFSSMRRLLSELVSIMEFPEKSYINYDEETGQIKYSKHCAGFVSGKTFDSDHKKGGNNGISQKTRR